MQNCANGPDTRRSRPLLTLRTQNSDYYISRTGIKMRSGQYAAPVRTLMRGEGARSSAPRSFPRSPVRLIAVWVFPRSPVRLIAVWVQADLRAVTYG